MRADASFNTTWPEKISSMEEAKSPRYPRWMMATHQSLSILNPTPRGRVEAQRPTDLKKIYKKCFLIAHTNPSLVRMLIRQTVREVAMLYGKH